MANQFGDERFEEIRNKNGEKLDYAFHCGNPESKHIVVLGHGVTGNKDRPFLVALSHALEDQRIQRPALLFCWQWGLRRSV